MKQTILFTTNDKMGVITENNNISFFKSQYVDQYNRNKKSIRERNEWKSQGSGAKFMGAAEDLSYLDESNTFHRITGICDAGKQGEFIYAVQVDEFIGVFSKSINSKDNVEEHILHSNNVLLYDMDYSREKKKIILSLGHGQADRHLAILDPETSKYQVITEGDAIDGHPIWSKVHADTILYESCGIGFDGNGIARGVSETGICRLNLKSGEIDELINCPGFDCIKPKEDQAGNIYYIKRPKADSINSGNPLMLAIRIALIPFKLVKALFMWMNFFTIRYTGESLSPRVNNGTKAKEKSKEELFIEGNLIKAAENEKLNQKKGEKYAGILPHNWQLMKCTPSGEMSVIKEGVLDFDICTDGTIIYSNGKYLVKHLNNGTEEKIAEVSLADHIKILEGES